MANWTTFPCFINEYKYNYNYFLRSPTQKLMFSTLTWINTQPAENTNSSNSFLWNIIKRRLLFNWAFDVCVWVCSCVCMCVCARACFSDNLIIIAYKIFIFQHFMSKLTQVHLSYFTYSSRVMISVENKLYTEICLDNYLIQGRI